VRQLHSHFANNWNHWARRFPLFVSVHKICVRECVPSQMLDFLRNSVASLHVD